MRFIVASFLLVAGCSDNFDPASYLDYACSHDPAGPKNQDPCKIRVLGVKAEPPERAPGETSALSVLALDTAGQPFTTSAWTCLVAPTVGTNDPANDACLDAPPKPYLLPLGQLDSPPSHSFFALGQGDEGVSFTMPNVSPDSLGIPDSTTGLYVPVRLHLDDGVRTAEAIYRVRYSLKLQPENQNPHLADVFVVVDGPDGGADAQLTSLDFNQPPEVKRGGQITLRATFTDDSVEPYKVLAGTVDNPEVRMTMELPRVNWYTTAGSFSEEVTDVKLPDTVFRADQRLPDQIGPDGFIVEIYIVGRDERGGTDWTHRRLLLR
jgi:hypothetical protein